MIYPTRRAVALVALGVPVAIAFGLAAPKLWLAGVTWIIFAFGITLIDVLAAPRRGRLDLVPELPGGLAIGQDATAALAISFAGRAPKWAEATVSFNRLVRFSPLRRSVDLHAGANRAEFTLTPLRRGEGRLERSWVRWQGPLGLVWLQRNDELGRNLPIMPNVGAVKEQAMQLFRRDAPMGAHVQLATGEGAEFHALHEFQKGMDIRTIDWKLSAKHAALLAR